MGTFIKTIKIITITALMLVWVKVQPAYAASLVVNTNTDNTTAGDSRCTLREAINNANSDSDTTSGDCVAGAGADTISFAGNYTITLSGSQLPVVTTTITINGNGTTKTIIQANANPNVATNRIFEVSNTGNLTLNGLAVRNGRCNGACSTSANNGGGIYSAGTLTLTNSTISANSADTDGGGGIYGTSNASITITDSTVFNNTVNCIGNIFCGGGGLKGGGTVTITNSAISNNLVICTLNPLSYCDGGGVYNDILTATTNISNSTISDNAVGSNGGTYIGGRGGGILYGSGTLNITNSTISGNFATDGAGIYNWGTLTILSSEFTSNSAYDWGGGINNGGSLIVDNSIFSDNYAATYGGGIHNGSGTLILTHSTLSNNQAYEGGGMTILGGTVTVMNSTFYANSSYYIPDGGGGGIYLQTNLGSLTVMNSTLSANSAPIGGGIYNFIGSVTLFNTIVANSPNGSNCVQASGTITANNYNIDTDGSCDSATQRTSAQVKLRPLADNGGTTQTMALGSGSLAIDAGDPTICANSSVNNEDQRGVVRPQGAGCDVGAYEADVLSPPSSLPKTGFAPNHITSLPAQPANLTYNNLGDIWLEIPSLNIKTDIIGVPQSSNGWNVDWLGQSAGWLNGTAFPSWEGNSVITAHVTDSNGKNGPFANIKNLKHGDKIIVHMYGEKYIFEVRNSNMVTPSSTKSALEHLEGHSYLTLITCQTYNPLSDSYLFRRVVRAVLMETQME
jgi:LPXTG-site transpeptidase (sortase) family protein